MKNKQQIFNGIIFILCYLISLMINICFGIQKIGFGSLLYFLIVFCFIETIQIMFFTKKILICMYPIGVYIAYCITSILIIVIPGREFSFKNVFLPSLQQFFLLLFVSLVLSVTGFITLYIVNRKRKNMQEK